MSSRSAAAHGAADSSAAPGSRLADRTGANRPQRARRSLGSTGPRRNVRAPPSARRGPETAVADDDRFRSPARGLGSAGRLVMSHCEASRRGPPSGSRRAVGGHRCRPRPPQARDGSPDLSTLPCSPVRRGGRGRERRTGSPRVALRLGDELSLLVTELAAQQGPLRSAGCAHAPTARSGRSRAVVRAARDWTPHTFKRCWRGCGLACCGRRRPAVMVPRPGGLGSGTMTVCA